MNIQIEDIDRYLDALVEFRKAVGTLWNSADFEAKQGSKAHTERTSSNKPEWLLDASCQAELLIQASDEHSMVMQASLREPVWTIASWASLRGCLVTGSLAAWLLDPNINEFDRVRRSLAFRYEGLSQQIKYGRESGHPPEKVERLQQRICHIASEAVTHGFPEVRDRNRRLIGIGQIMPSETDIVAHACGDASLYRLTSAVVHGHSWAISQMSFRQVEPGEFSDLSRKPREGSVRTVKSMKPLYVLFMAVEAFKAFSRPVFYLFQYNGWDLVELRKQLEKVADKMNMKPEPRFWNSPH